MVKKQTGDGVLGVLGTFNLTKLNSFSSPSLGAQLKQTEDKKSRGRKKEAKRKWGEETQDPSRERDRGGGREEARILLGVAPL